MALWVASLTYLHGAHGQCVGAGSAELPPIYAVSVPRHKARWDRLVNNSAPSLRSSLTRWLAHDASEFSADWLATRNASIFPGWKLSLDDPSMFLMPGHMQTWPYPVPYNVWYWSRSISPGEAALALSSHDVWAHLAKALDPKSGMRPWAIILEDDAVLPDAKRLCAFVATIEASLAHRSLQETWLVYLMTGTLCKDLVH